MLILRKIVLRIGAIFLLVTLKTHGGLARSVSKSGQQSRMPETNSNRDEEIVKLSNFSDSFFVSGNQTEVGHFMDLPRRRISTTEFTENSTFDNYNSSHRMNFNVPSFDISYSNVLGTHAPEGANSSITPDQEKELNNVTDSYKFSPDTEEEDRNLGEKSLELNSLQKTTDKVSPTNLTTETKKESLIVAGRRAIKNLGNDLKRLKSNVDNFRQNLRKFLFESDMPTSAKREHSTVPLKNETLRDEAQNASRNEFSYLRTFRNISNKSSNEIKKNTTASPAPRVQSFTRISAAAANMSEASKRMGDFLKEQYWNTKEKYEQNAQETMMSRGEPFGFFTQYISHVFRAVILFKSIKHFWYHSLFYRTN